MWLLWWLSLRIKFDCTRLTAQALFTAGHFRFLYLYSWQCARACVQFRLPGCGVRGDRAGQRGRTPNNPLVHDVTKSTFRSSRPLPTAAIHNIPGTSARRKFQANRLPSHVSLPRGDRLPTTDHELTVSHRLRLEVKIKMWHLLERGQR